MTQEEIEEYNEMQNLPVPEPIEETYEEVTSKENDGVDYSE